MKNIITFLSFTALIVANLVALAWFFDEGGYEPLLTSLLIFAAITGFFVERWLAEKNKRKELLISLAHEMYINMNLLNDKVFFPKTEEEKSKFVVFPRLESTLSNTLIWSGSFSGIKDKNLFKLLHEWREKVQQLNRRLELTESACMLNSTPNNITKWREKLSSGKVLKQVRDAYNNITKEILDNYSNESGITNETMLFK